MPFNEINRTMARYTSLTYPDFNATFKMHTDVSKLQLGEVISQKGKPIDLYSRKLTDSKKSYTVTGKDLPNIDETLKELRNILLVQKLRIYTDNKNLTCQNFNTDRVLIWKLIL